MKYNDTAWVLWTIGYIAIREKSLVADFVFQTDAEALEHETKKWFMLKSV